MPYITPTMKKIEDERGKSIEDVLIELFDKHGNRIAVAADLGLDQSTLTYWLMRLGLEQRTVLVPRKEQEQ